MGFNELLWSSPDREDKKEVAQDKQTRQGGLNMDKKEPSRIAADRQLNNEAPGQKRHLKGFRHVLMR